MQNQYTAEAQSQFLIEGQTPPQIQVQYQTIPLNQPNQYQTIPQYQQQPIYIIQGNQQNPNNNIIINDSNFCSEMCCTLIWLIFTVIPSISTVFILRGFYLYLNIIFIIAALLIIISICTKNVKLYKVGIIFYSIYAILNIISNLVIVIMFWAFADKLSQYLGITIAFDLNTQEEKDAVEQSLFVYKLIFTFALVLQISIASAILNCLKKKIIVFKAYDNYVKNMQNGLIKQ